MHGPDWLQSMECGQPGHHGASVTSRVKTVPGSGQEIALVRSTMELNARDQTMKSRLASPKCVQVKCIFQFSK